MSEPTKDLTPAGLANQLFTAALAQYPKDPREAVRQFVIFLTKTLIHAIVETSGDEAACRAVLKSVGETIATTPIPSKSKP